MIIIMEDISAIHITVLILSGFILLVLLFYLLRSDKNAPKGVLHHGREDSAANEGSKPCPLCGEMLKRGETVHSVLYPGKPDSLMEIYGCPYCEKTGSKNSRTCPVCKKTMKPDSVLIARVFEKPGKKHVHVLGCSSCYSGRSRVKSD